MIKYFVQEMIHFKYFLTLVEKFANNFLMPQITICAKLVFWKKIWRMVTSYNRYNYRLGSSREAQSYHENSKCIFVRRQFLFQFSIGFLFIIWTFEMDLSPRRKWSTYELIPPSYPTASPTPKFWFLGVGEASRVGRRNELLLGPYSHYPSDQGFHAKHGALIRLSGINTCLKGIWNVLKTFSSISIPLHFILNVRLL